MTKVNAVSQDTFARLSDIQIYEATVKWAQHYHPQYVSLLEQHKDLCIQAIGIERHDGNDPKRFITYQDVISHCQIFVDQAFDEVAYPNEWTSLTQDQITSFVHTYIPTLNLSVSKEEWFESLKETGKSL